MRRKVSMTTYLRESDRNTFMENLLYCAPGHIFCRTNKVMVTVDGSEGSSRAATVAFEIGEMTKSKVYIIHVIPTPFVKQVALMSDSNEEEILRKYTVKGEQLLQGVKNAANEYGLEVELILDKGSPSERIIALSKQLKVDLVVMGAHGASSGSRSNIGSAAERVMFGIDCPILIVK